MNKYNKLESLVNFMKVNKTIYRNTWKYKFYHYDIYENRRLKHTAQIYSSLIGRLVVPKLQ